ncbi:hypothetical protein ACFFQW_41170 [Umezawaea endophytica]|uniref:Secreted protein n=1 Tax=Umezawaea endophytica TaxID=1654476 RepID=A0A9X2ZZC9_9PSEU|nr:hypothetical protein [Umezawaea endophytica]MCS7475738.1 hypothetical protein [Umezawaea endophytica]
MGAVVVKGAVVAVLAAVVLVPEAGAAGNQVSGSCRSGSFSGSFTLAYEADGEAYLPTAVRGGVGPYIGDSGTVKIRLSHVDATGVEHEAYLKTRTGVPAGRFSFTIPSGTSLPRTNEAAVAVSFSGGGSGCSAKAELR